MLTLLMRASMNLPAFWWRPLSGWERSCCYIFWLTLSACSAKEAPLGGSQGMTHQITDQFSVGTEVVVRALAIDHANSELWVGTSIGALQIDLSTLQVRTTITRDNGLANEYVFALLVARDRTVWAGTNGGGVSRMQNQQWKTFFPMHGLADYWVYSFAEQGDDIWIGTWAGLSRYSRSKNTFQTYVKELVNEWVYGLDVDAQGALWIGTEGGVNRFDGKTWSVWTHQDGLGAPNKDGLPSSDNTGLGTRQRHDLSVMQAGQPTYNPNYVFCILVDMQNRVWAGTWGGGVSLLQQGRWKNFTQQDGLAGNIVYSIAQDPAGKIWVGTDGGVSMYNGQAWHSLTQRQGLPQSNVYAIAADAQGVWLGLKGFVVRLGHLAVQKRSSL